MGWVVYFVFLTGYSQILNSEGYEVFVIKFKSEQIALILPFLVGYSTRLAIGVLNKGIRAIELTLGIEDPRETTITRKTK